MKMFKAMIDMVKHEVILASMDKNKVLSCCDEVRPFVALTEKIQGVEVRPSESYSEDDIDLPFPVCSFENANYNRILMIKGSNFKQSMIKFGQEHSDIAKKIMENGVPVRMSCILVREVLPKKYDIFVYDSVSNQIIDFSYTENWKDEYKSILAYIKKDYLSKIGTSDIGEMKTKERIKYKHDGHKKVKTIKKVVIINQTKTKPERIDGNSVTWDYSHRWEVRGHWRKCRGVGKDREGDYCIDGFTWVRAHEKGPEDASVIKKTRVVK